MVFCRSLKGTTVVLHLLLITIFGQAYSVEVINPVACSNYSTGESGLCMFTWNCIHVAHGIHIASCVDGFLIGSCCKLPENIRNSAGATSKETQGTVTWSSDKQALAQKNEASIHSAYEELFFKLRTQQEQELLNDHRLREEFDALLGAFVQKPVIVSTETPSAFKYLEDLSSSARRYDFGNPLESVTSDSTHNLRKPVVLEASHNLRKPVITDATHDLQKPVKTHPSHDLRQPVASETTHNLRKPGMYNTVTIFRYGWNGNLTSSNDEESNSNSSINTVSEPFSSHNSIHDSQSGLYDKTEIKITSVVDTNLVDETSPSYSHSESFSTGQPEHDEMKKNSNAKSCGISKSRKFSMARIVGGRITRYLEWPWMISLRRLEGKTFKHKCGAVLLNDLWVITVAHCVEKKHPNEIILRLGDYDLHNEYEFYPHVEMRVLLVIIHPDFNALTYENDVALLRFYHSAPQQVNIAPVCLTSSSYQLHGKTALVTGWGRLSENGELPAELREVPLPILNNSECERMYAESGYYESIPDVFICAGLGSGGFDACEGDSGGPMIVKNEQGHWSLVGLISWGIGCAAPMQPGVYVRVSKYLDWIDNIISI